MATHAPHLVRNSLVTAGLILAGSAGGIAVAGPAAAASSAAPTPVPSSTAAPSPVATGPAAPSSSATPPAAPTPSLSSDPGSITVPAGNAYARKGDSGTPWEPIGLLGGGLLLLGAGGLSFARRR